MVLLDTGCLCCTVRGDLVQTLTDLYAKRANGTVPPFGNVIIETTGLADPVPVLQTIVADEELGRIYRLHDVVTLVDAVHGEAQLDTHPESVKQAAVADALLITKTDLAPPEAIAALRARGCAASIPARKCTRPCAARSIPRFSSGGLYDASSKAPEVERWLKAERHGATVRRSRRTITT